MKAHVVIGGPLDGEFATSGDFYGRWKSDEMKHEEGMYEHLKGEYVQFNNANRRSHRRGQGGRAHVAWIHLSLLPPAINPRER